MRNLFVTADLHLEHPGILRHCRRPWLQDGDLDERGKWVSKEVMEARVEEMNEAICAKWNSIVSPKDTTIIVGDAFWKNHAKWIQRLNGKLILIWGDHDKMSQKVSSQFTETHWILRRSIDKQYTVFCHWPMLSWSRSFHGAWHIHGHSHGRVRETGTVFRFDIGMDVWDYAPVPWGVVKEKMATIEENRRTAPKVDWHDCAPENANRNTRFTSVGEKTDEQ